MPAAHVICWALVLSAPITAAVTFTILIRQGASAGPLPWLGFVYVATVSMFLAFFGFYRGMAEAGIARVSQLQLAQPVLTLLWSALFVGERIDAPTVAATLFVILCVLVTLKTRVRVPFAVTEAP
jgi:drug/metabolite transporter (DMT)-like permease